MSVSPQKHLKQYHNNKLVTLQNIAGPRVVLHDPEGGIISVLANATVVSGSSRHHQTNPTFTLPVEQVKNVLTDMCAHHQ